MKQLKLRFAGPEDAGTLLEWLEGNPENDFDRDILGYPTLQIVCAYSEQGPVAYLPIQKALVLESTARAPGISEGDSAQALRDFTKAAELMASSQGIREIYFLCKDERLVAMAKSHGYDELPWKTMRMKLS